MAPAEFPRIARREKKVFLSNQCKEIEQNNRMGKTRDLFKKLEYQGNISCKDGLNKGQKWYGPIKSRRSLPASWNAKSSGALGSITVNKASGGDGIPVEVFQILKDDAVKVLHSICQQI